MVSDTRAKENKYAGCKGDRKYLGDKKRGEALRTEAGSLPRTPHPSVGRTWSCLKTHSVDRARRGLNLPCGQLSFKVVWGCSSVGHMSHRWGLSPLDRDLPLVGVGCPFLGE